jgi:hypothetical protein
MLEDSVSDRKKNMNMKTVVNAVIPANTHTVAGQVFHRVLYSVASKSSLIVARREI